MIQTRRCTSMCLARPFSISATTYRRWLWREPSGVITQFRAQFKSATFKACYNVCCGTIIFSARCQRAKSSLKQHPKKMSRRAKSRRFLLLLPFVRAKMSRALMQFSPKWILNWSCWNMCVELLLFRCQRHDLRVAKAKAHDDDERPEKYFN